MFVTKEAIKERTGYDVDGTTLALAHMMVEAWAGKSESQIVDASDRDIMGRATTFQAVYILGNIPDVLQQMAIKSVTQGDANYVMDTTMFAPYMSPWAIRTCRNLSWMGTRSVHTGPVFDRYPRVSRWETD